MADKLDRIDIIDIAHINNWSEDYVNILIDQWLFENPEIEELLVQFLQDIAKAEQEEST